MDGAHARQTADGRRWQELRALRLGIGRSVGLVRACVLGRRRRACLLGRSCARFGSASVGRSGLFGLACSGLRRRARLRLPPALRSACFGPCGQVAAAFTLRGLASGRAGFASPASLRSAPSLSSPYASAAAYLPAASLRCASLCL